MLIWKIWIWWIRKKRFSQPGALCYERSHRSFTSCPLTSTLRKEEATTAVAFRETAGEWDGCLCDTVEHCDLRSSGSKDSLESKWKKLRGKKEKEREKVGDRGRIKSLREIRRNYVWEMSAAKLAWESMWDSTSTRGLSEKRNPARRGEVALQWLEATNTQMTPWRLVWAARHTSQRHKLAVLRPQLVPRTRLFVYLLLRNS